jgi:TolB-like protein/DNA-binding winged helix-turn-helix (wHTH) protein/Tfp pilus assembly protein PilF
MPEPMRYQFGPFTLDTASYRLRRGTSELPVTPKAFEILALLVRERRRALTKQELLDSVWPNTAVTENTLTQRIREIREALGDSAQEPTYVRTIPRIGFEFVGDVVELTPLDDGTPNAREASGPEPDAYEGIDRAERADQQRGRSFWRSRLAAASIAVLAMAAALLYVMRPDRPSPPPADAGGRLMLAVLPFENLSGDPEQGYIGDGLTEEMIAELGRLDPSRLGVIARTSVMAYQSTTKSVAEIARELGVAFVLEGSVRREADRVRIVAQLIRASDQTHVWAERYDRDLGSILSLQSEVAGAIARETRITLSKTAEKRLRSVPTVDPEAYQSYLKGRFFLNRRTGDAIQRAMEQFERAIAIEPAYAQAHAGLADAHELRASYGSIAPQQSLERAMQAAGRALTLDPELSEAHSSLGNIHTSYTWDWDGAERAFTRALELNPSNALAHKGYGELLSFLGRHDEAIREARRAIELDPLSLLMQANLAIVFHRARRSDEALEQIQQTLAMDPNYMLGHLNLGLIFAARQSYAEAAAAFERARGYAPEFADAHALLAYAYGRAGRHDEARAIAMELRRLGSERYMSGYVRAHYHLGVGNVEEAISELERARDERSWLVALLKVDPLLDDLRPYPRFQALLRKMKFPG